MPDGTTAQRPTGAAGMFRYNTTLSALLKGIQSAWGAIGGAGASTFARKEFAGDGSTTAFTLDTAPSDENDLIIFIEGVYQNQDAYSVSGTTLTMADAPVNGRGLVVYQVSAAVAGAGMAVNTMTGDNSDTTLTLAVAPGHVNNVQVFFDGVYQKADTYTVSGTTLTFGVAPPSGVLVEARTHSQTEINTFPATGISGLTAVQPVAGDFMMILDATDSALKKADVKDIMATAVSITSAADAVALTFDSSENATFAGNITAVDLDISGDVDIDGTLEADAITVNGTTLAETISDTVGAMVTSNTESGITVAYQDADNTLDFTIGTLNQNTTGSAATLTTARTIGGTSFDGSANIAVGLAATATTLATARTIGGTSFDGSANIAVGLAATATTLATARTIGGVSFNGSANIDLPGVNSAGNQNTSGTAATVTGAAQTAITSVGTLTALTVDDITLNGSTISDGADLTLDVGGNIVLDANGGGVYFKDDGTTIGFLQNDGGDFRMISSVSDKDIKFLGNDGGSTITALTLDMSDAGTAIFNHDVQVPDNGKFTAGAGSDLQIYHDGSNSYIAESGSGSLVIKADDLYIQNAAGSENMALFAEDGAVTLYHNNSAKIATSSTGVSVTGSGRGTLTTDNDGSFDMNASNNFKCTPSGNFTLTFTNIASQSGNILLINSGGHTVSAHSNTKVDANILGTISTAGTYLLAYFSDGTNVYMTNSAIYS